jgi:hypothetical protein
VAVLVEDAIEGGECAGVRGEEGAEFQRLEAGRRCSTLALI